MQVRHFALVLDLEDVRDESSGGDAELAPELDDNPGTTRDTKFSVLHKSSYLVWLSGASDRWPTHRYILVLRRVFQVIELQASKRSRS